jgi:probable phosphoglycerate mutase
LETATVLLIRHAAHDQLGSVLSGRSEGLGLSQDGRRQAEGLARVLGPAPIEVLESSPVRRARETADAIARRRRGLVVMQESALQEIDFGEWTGRSFLELSGDPQWNRWNSARAVSRAPGGESMAAAQQRIRAHIEQAAERWGSATVAMVSHADIIRAAVAWVLDLSLDAILRFVVSPGSVTRLRVGKWGAELQSLNETPWRSRT